MTATLYGAPHSLYTGRARSYLIKAGIPYRESSMSTPHYRNHVLAKAGGRQGVPTLETTDGEVIRDGAAIIDHYEATGGQTFAPSTPRQRVISLLFDVIGAEGLLRPAMHYRWNFDEQNLDFLRYHFQMIVPPEMADRADGMMDNMRNAGRAFGTVEETFALVESLYEELLVILENHFIAHPYLLGGRPCIGDFGMIAPLFAHLGRDPKPLAMMQAMAPHLYRWVERMNRSDADVGEFVDCSLGYLNDDEIPETLVAVLKHLAIDFVPETKAAADCINDWLAGQEDLTPGTEAQRAVGLATFDVRGITVNAIAQPYRFYLLKRVQDEVDSLNDDDRAAAVSLLEKCDMATLLDFRLSREIGRQNNLEVWR